MNNKGRDHDAPAVRPQTSVIVTDRSNKLHSSWHHWPLTSTENNHCSVPLSTNKIQRPVSVWITVCFGLFWFFFSVWYLFITNSWFFLYVLRYDLRWSDEVNRYDFFFEIYSKCRPNISLSISRISSIWGFNLYPLSLFFQDIIIIDCVYSIKLQIWSPF